MTNTLTQLHHELNECGIALTPEQETLLLKHLNLVLETNKILNLTRIDSVESGITLHIVDSLILLPYLNTGKGPFLDLGTGAGFPGIPLLIASEQNAMLCDSVKKKVTAVQGFLEELGLVNRAEISSERAEDLGRTKRGSFGSVVARAVAETAVLVEYATPLLRKGGRLLITKGRMNDEERAAGHKAAQICGMSLVRDDHHELPREMGHREVLVYEKTGKARVKLPRRVGKAKAEPLGKQ